MKRLNGIIGVIAILTLALGSVPTFAQTPDESLFPVPPVVTEERVTLVAGDTLEIAAETGVRDATYSWIMTQGRTFIEAQRERFFRYRFVNDNVYTLRAEAVFSATGERFQRTFIVEVLPAGSTALPVPPMAGTGAAIAGTMPAPDVNGRVVLAAEQQLVKLVPLRTDLTPLAVDFDTATDGDGDGSPGNDIDNINAYNGFHSFGKPLWIWYVKPVMQINLAITAIPTEGSPLVQRINIMSEDVARIQGVLTSPVSMTIEQTEDATFTFTPVVAPKVNGVHPLLYEWQFGDGGRSLETLAVHTYASEGPFEVSLSVRDLQTGNEIGSAKTTVSPVIAEPIPLEPTEPIPTEPTELQENESSLDWGRIGLIAGLFVGALILGFAVIWLLSFLRKSRKLEQTLESMENAIVPSKDQSPPSLAIKSKQTAPTSPERPTPGQQKVIDAEISSSSSPKQPPAPVVEAKAPDWLKKGLSTNPQKATATAPAAPKTPAPAPPSTPVPKIVPTPAPPVPKPVTPPVLPTTPKPAPPAPTPVPKPMTPPTPKATVAPAQPAPAAPDASKMPRWLQQPPASAQPTPPAPAPASTPPPATVPAAAPITPPAPVAPPAPVTPPTPVTAPVVPVPQAPKPVPVAPKPNIPAATKPAPASAPPTLPPSPATPASPTQPSNPGKDDDQPIAIIRAESIDPGPKA